MFWFQGSLKHQNVDIFRQHKNSLCLKFKGMVCVSLKRGEFIQLCKLINAGFHGGTSHLRPLAFESVWNHMTHCVQNLKSKCKCIVVKKKNTSLASILCMCYISTPSCTSTVKSSRRLQRGPWEESICVFWYWAHNSQRFPLYTWERLSSSLPLTSASDRKTD